MTKQSANLHIQNVNGENPVWQTEESRPHMAQQMHCQQPLKALLKSVHQTGTSYQVNFNASKTANRSPLGRGFYSFFDKSGGYFVLFDDLS